MGERIGVSIRLPVGLRDILDAEARQRMVSRNLLILMLLERGVNDLLAGPEVTGDGTGVALGPSAGRLDARLGTFDPAAAPLPVQEDAT